MTISVSKVAPGAQRLGNLRINPVDLTLDSSYTSGFDLATVLGKIGVGASTSHIIGVKTIGGNPYSHNFDFRWNPTTKLLQAYRKGAQPALIVEEAVTVASNTGTLKRIPGYIIAVEVTAGSVTGAFRVIPTGKTPTTTMVAVALTTGVMTFLSTDAVTAVRVTYIPLGVGPFTEANRIVDEAVTLATAGVDLANRAALIQYVWNDTATTSNRLPAIQPVGESPSTNQIAIDIKNTAATTITPNSAQNTNSALVTYFKFSGIDLRYGWTDQADISVSSNAVVFGEAADLSGIWIPAFGNVVVGETGASANLQARLVGPSGSTATNVAVFDPAKNTLSLASGDAYATIEMPYVILDSLLPGFVEVQNSEDLSLVVVRLELITK